MTSASDEPMAPADVTSGDVRSPPSDTDERPVRKQLKETSIDSSNNKGPSEDSAPATSAQEQGSSRKRSFEEARGDTDDAIENGDGPRKRSRESTPEDLKKGTGTTVPTLDNSTKNRTTADAMNDDDTKTMKKKRSLEQLEAEGVKEPDETEKKRHRDTSQESENKTANAFAQSAFASAAASSPFARLGGSTSTSTQKPTSTSAFASSALSSFAGAENSPFGSLGSSKPSVFKSGSGMSGFGSTSTSGFGSLKSGFAGVGGGFAAAAKSGGLTNFASPNAPATIGGEPKPKPKPAKPIGTEESGDEGSDNEDGEETTTFEADKTDERFFEQTIETGEEEEETLFTCKGKLFHFSGEWKERGVGTFKINARKDDTGKQHGRMIMRADGALRVMLNSPVFKGMTFGDAKNEEPSSKQIFLASNEEGRTVPLLLRVGNEALAKDLYVVIKDLLDDE